MVMFFRHRLADYSKWKPYFDEHESVRRDYGCTAHSVYRDAERDDTFIVALKWKDFNRAKEFAGSDTLRSTMERAGVQGTPEIWYAEDIEEKRY